MNTFIINTNYPSVEHLRRRTQQRIPGFVWDYLTGGCNDDLNVTKNNEEIRRVELVPYYLSEHTRSNTHTTLLGDDYDAPFGISPVGLQSLTWPGSAKYLASAALRHNIPFILSTTTTLSIEEAAELTAGRFWYQLYYPTDNKITDDMLRRLTNVGCKTIVLLADVPTFAWRPKDLRNGFGLPIKMNLRNTVDLLTHPAWSLATLRNGTPTFHTMKNYMPEGMSFKELAKFMDNTFSGRLTTEKIDYIQQRWQGNIVIKGIASRQDAEKAIALGINGIIVSNHGGRQLDAGPSSIKSLQSIATCCKGKIALMLDSGVRSGPDIARVIASGADFVFAGRPFMFGCGALGKHGADQVIAILKRELQQVMEQLCCQQVTDLPQHLLKN